MLIDLFKMMLAGPKDRDAHDRVETQLANDSEAWACAFRDRHRQRHMAAHRPRREDCPAPRHEWRRATALFSMAAAVAIAAIIGGRAYMGGADSAGLPVGDPSTPLADEGGGAFAVAALIEQADRAPADALQRELTGLAADAEAGVDALLAFLPSAPDHADPPQPDNAGPQRANNRHPLLPNFDLPTIRFVPIDLPRPI